MSAIFRCCLAGCNPFENLGFSIRKGTGLGMQVRLAVEKAQRPTGVEREHRHFEPLLVVHPGPRLMRSGNC